MRRRTRGGARVAPGVRAADTARRPSIPIAVLRPLLLPVAAGLLLLAAPAQAEEGVCPQLDLMADAPSLGDGSPELTLTADDVDLVRDGVSQLDGRVELRQADKVFRAEALEYEDSLNQVRVDVESTFRNPELLIRSQSATFDLENENGEFRDTRFTLTERAARGGAEIISLSRDGGAALEDARYTTCAPDSEAWFIEASQIRLNHDTGLGTAKHARIRFGGVPILYLPYFQFPIDGERRTGLLFPTVGQSDNTGFDIRWPVYLNLGPNYDATLTPRYMSDRGLMLMSEGRYLMREGEGFLGYDVLPQDRAQDEDDRSYFRAEHRGLINDRLAVDVRFAEISDLRYFEDFGGEIDLAAITHLERSARLTYQAPASYTLQALVQDYQTIAANLQPIDEPYRRLPQIRFSALTQQSLFNTRAGIRSEYVNFARADSLEGQRIDLRPFLRFERDELSRYVVAELDYRYTGYQLSEAIAGTSTPDRSLPSLGVEGGLRFERISDGGSLQTLEPRAFYLYVPYRDQDALPLFDAGEPDFDFTQLFARNRYSGEDRVSDAHHVAMAATTRLLDPRSGEVRWSASVGQLYRIDPPRVDLPGFETPDAGATDFIASVDYRLSRRISASIASQWSPDQNQFDRSRLALRYREGGRDVQMAYRYRADQLEQADVAAHLPIAGGFNLSGRWRYSMAEHQSLDLFAGIGYETCCWAVNTAYRRYIAGTDGNYNSGIYLQLELKGLTRIGGGLEALLPGAARSDLP
jgi:LPS-assembly protein